MGPQNYTNMVLGFYIQRSRSRAPRIWLIRKVKPIWQKGLFNGIGGRIEEGETPLDAMRREFYEEAGLDITEWEHVVILHHVSNAPWRVDVFRAFGTETPPGGQEEIDPQWFYLDGPWSDHCVPNLKVLIPLIQQNFVFPVVLEQAGQFPEILTC